MTDELVDYLKTVPDDFVISWFCDEMTEDRPFSLEWAEVWFEGRVAWTIVRPWDTESCSHCLRVAPDYVAAYLTDETTGHPLGAALLRLGWQVDAEDIAGVGAAQEGAAKPMWVGGCAWSSREINRAIEAWCLEHLGRPLQAQWDPEHGPALLRQAQETLDRVRSGQEPSYLLKPGREEGGEGPTVTCSEEVMEWLLQEMLEDET